MSSHNLPEEEVVEETYLHEDDLAEDVPYLEDGEPMDDDEDEEDEPDESLLEGYELTQSAEDEDLLELEDDSVQGFFKHQEPVYAVDMHPQDATLVASGGGDDKGYLWQIGNEDESLVMDGHTDSVTAVAFSATGDYVATGGMDGKVNVYNVKEKKLVCSVDGPDEVLWIEWHPKGNILLAGASDSTVWMWMIPSGNFMNVFNGHAAPVNAGCFTPNGKEIVTVSEDKSLIVWDPKTAIAKHRISGEEDARFHSEPVTAIAVSKDNTLAISGSMNGEVRLVNILNGSIIAALDKHTDSIETISFCDVLHLAATGSVDGTITIWDIQTQKLRHSLSHDDAVVKVKFIKNKSLIVSCSADKTVKIWDARSGECLQTRKGHSNAVLDFAVSCDGNHVVTGSDDGNCLVFKV